MNDEEIINNVRVYVQNLSAYDDIHGFGHTKRVYGMCIYIGQKLHANLLILGIAALLHDIGRYSENGKHENRNHAELSAELAKKYISSNNLPLPENSVENISHSIKSHSFSNKVAPNTLEAKILSDADKFWT